MIKINLFFIFYFFLLFFSSILDLFIKPESVSFTPRKSPSNYELSRQTNTSFDSNGIHSDLECKIFSSSFGSSSSSSSIASKGEIDPVFHQQFLEWKKSPSLKKETSFINNIYEQEIYPVFNFKNQSLTELLLAGIEENSVTIESISDKCSFPK